MYFYMSLFPQTTNCSSVDDSDVNYDDLLNKPSTGSDAQLAEVGQGGLVFGL